MELIRNSTDLLLCIVLDGIEKLLIVEFRNIRYSDLDDNVCICAFSPAEQALNFQHHFTFGA